jgi:hypothetical protein
MSKALVRNGLWVGTLVAALALVASPAAARPRPGAQPRAFNLFEGILGRMNANQFDCGLNAFGDVCADPNGSTTVGGGFWPKGTPDQYVFNSGIQVAAVIPSGIAGFSWSGDTTGTFFFNASVGGNGDKLSLVWSSLNSSDLANWPRDAYIPNDTSLYNPVLIGRKSASQQDSWIQYWDGNPAQNNYRKHPLGILVTQRGMAWNFPTGNESVIYFIYTLTNVSASKKSVYDAVDPLHSDTLASIGSRFRLLNANAGIPDTGYTMQHVYVAFGADPDLSDQATINGGSVFFPEQMGFAYKNTFYESPSSGYKFLPPIFSAPFAQTMGFFGVKLLRTPLKVPGVPASGEVGLTLFSDFVNPNFGSFTDPGNAVQLWRYLSANLNSAAGDPGCSAPNPLSTHFCYISPRPVDIRFFMSSGELTLKPGQSQTIVVAYITAPPVDGPWIAARGPSFTALDFPGLPALDTALAAGHDTLRSIDRAAGAVSFFDKNADGHITQDEVTTVPRSLLSRGLVAQAVFDAKFLLPFPPDPPEFFLVPGDNQVTVVWRASATEQAGDPYYAIASNPASKLYDPNYRFIDVEGYRIYRGRTSGDLQLVAQFDYGGTAMRDYTGAFNYGNCAPELGVTAQCPAEITANYQFPADTLNRPVNPASYVAQPLAGDLVQIPPGGRVVLANGSVLIVQADTAVTTGGGSLCAVTRVCPKLSDTGVPFAFVDKGVRNSFRYFYAVTAFDVNSVASVGPGSTSLESAAATKVVTPRAPSGQQTAGALLTPVILGANGQPVPAVAAPTVDPTTGMWSGPQQPSNGVDLGLAAFLPEVLTNGAVTLKVDSITPGNGDPDGLGTGIPVTYYVTTQGAGAPVHSVVPVAVDCCDVSNSKTVNFPATAISTAKSTRYGGDSTYSLFGSATVTDAPPWYSSGPGRGDANADPGNSPFNGPRWWNGAANENTATPNAGNCHPSSGGCVPGAMAGKITAGALTGVTVLWNIQAYNTVRSFPMRDLEAVTASVYRAADFSLYWGTAGAIDSVVDDVHKVPVPFNKTINASWGVLNDSSFVGVTAANTPDGNNALLTWGDIFCVAPSPALTLNCTGTPAAVLMNHARLTPVAATSIALGSTNTLTTTGNGFIFYLNGKFFMMQMAALPTAGTIWHARFYTGNITGAPGSFAYNPNALTGVPIRPPAVPGMRVQIAYQGAAFSPATTTDAQLAAIHTVPDPYYVTNALEQSTNDKILRFVNLPSQCIVRIYSLSGILVNALTLNDPTGGGELTWNLRNRNNQFVASGVYFYHVETPDGKQRIGRFTVVNFAQ